MTVLRVKSFLNDNARRTIRRLRGPRRYAADARTLERYIRSAGTGSIRQMPGHGCDMADTRSADSATSFEAATTMDCRRSKNQTEGRTFSSLDRQGYFQFDGDPGSNLLNHCRHPAVSFDGAYGFALGRFER